MYKITVYAIAKNEEQFVDRWYDSVKEADNVVVLDTGSTDNTVKKLTEHGVKVTTEIITPWRFDVARNRALSLVPADTDICVSVDLDEFFEKGWRELLERAWRKDTALASYRYTWNFNADGSEGVVFWRENMHAYNRFKWVNPVHEVLKCTDKKKVNTIFVEGIQLNHKADNTKSRSSYLPLLELAVREEPTNDRNTHYLGREYMFYQQWDNCIKTLKHHLSMPSAVWRDERAASMRYIARSYMQLKNLQEAKRYLYLAIAEAPHLREPYIDMAKLMYDLSDWYGLAYFVNEALKIVERPRSYVCEADAWGALPYDLLSLAYYNTADYTNALLNVDKAISLAPLEERLKNNREFIKNKLDK